MTQNERVKEVRKKLNMTMETFSQKLGIARASMSNIENGKRNLTKQMATAICREFNVNPDWLSIGEGNMFIETEASYSEKIDRILAGENEFYKSLFKGLANLDEHEVDTIEAIINKFAEANCKKTSFNATDSSDIDKAVADYKHQLELEARMADELSASLDTQEA